ncbi:trigger factor [Lachnospiraceae bacterium]|nr:trigger factor [Lachnospiraceae bacterium]
MKRSAVCLGAALLAVLCLAGCGGSKKTGDSTSSSIDASKYVTLGNYKGLTVTVPDTTVSDDAVEASIETALESKSTTEAVTDRPVQDTDTVNIDYVGKKDGVAFDGGTAQGYNLTIGSHTFIDGFEDGLIGAKIGDVKTLSLTFPENYSSKDLAGQAVTFDVTINSISANIVPELTDAVAAELDAEVKTADEYRKKVRDRLEKSRIETAKSEVYANLMTQVQAGSTIVSGDELPKDLLDQNVETEKKSFESSLTMYGLDIETYLKQYGMSQDEFNDQIEEYAKNITQQQLLVAAIAQAENIKVDDEYLEKRYEEDSKIYGYDSAKAFREAVKKQGAEKTYRDSLLAEKVEELLFDNANVTNPEMVSWK